MRDIIGHAELGRTGMVVVWGSIEDIETTLPGKLSERKTSELVLDVPLPGKKRAVFADSENWGMSVVQPRRRPPALWFNFLDKQHRGAAFRTAHHPEFRIDVGR